MCRNGASESQMHLEEEDLLKKKIVNLYQYFHNLQYKYDPNKKR